MLTALYIHIPFCAKICTYCDFHKEVATVNKQEKYLISLINELEFYKSDYNNLATIYIGGGTPSSLSVVLLEKLLFSINKVINIKKLVEFTIETNPNDITKEKADLFKKYGISRVSIGVQTFHKEHLKFLGRTHNKKDVVEAIKILRNSGITNINIDMIFSLINQTLKELTIDLEDVLKLEIKHISYYSLILEEKTVLYHLYKQNLLSMNDEDLESLMYNKVIDTLIQNGYNHYEISNFSKSGFESRHNIVYWQNQEYLGIGSGAHSLYKGKRFANISNVSKYIENANNKDFPQTEFYDIEPLREELMMGLRLLKGINIKYVNSKYQTNIFEVYPKIYEFIDNGMLILKNDQLFFSRQGLLLGNIVFSIF